MSQIDVNANKILKGDINQLLNLLSIISSSELPLPNTLDPISSFDILLPILSELTLDAPSDGIELQVMIDKSLYLKKSGITSELKIRLILAERLFLHIVNQTCFDKALTNIILSLHLPFLITALVDDTLYCNRNHPMRCLVDNIFSQGTTWYPQQGKISSSFPEQLKKIISAITAIIPQNTAGITAYLDTLAKYQQDFFLYLSDEIKRAKNIEMRTCKAEAGLAIIAHAQKKVINIINENLAQQMLPEDIAEFIHNIWKNEFQYILINQGEKSITWNKWVSILKKLPHVFQPQQELQNQLYDDIILILQDISLPTIPNTCSMDEYQEFIDTLEMYLMQRLKGIEITCIEVKELTVPGEVENIKTTVSKSLSQKAISFKENDWFLFSITDDETIRCKLALKMLDTEQLLFVNRYGHKVMQKSFDDFVICITSKIAKPLSVAPPFNLSFVQTVDDLINYYESNLERAKQEKNKQNEINARLERERKERIEAEEQIKKAAAIKAIKEAEALAKEKKLQQKKSQELAESLLDQLSIGSWLEIPNNDGILTRCKLAVCISSSGRYIFVNQVGIKVIEYSYEALLELFVGKQAKILSKGEKFEDQLAKIVQQQRNDVV
ncbi:DUF1631 family protein [Spartinivicinus ruber]|uniref:DUF1631 family protein n=1 Tax=Spartinivicinus ruber TaxID=2683272 RepID=UPI0013D1E7A6|nr:DUF1631 family protein [Spartinivicinus ruber]